MKTGLVRTFSDKKSGRRESGAALDSIAFETPCQRVSVTLSADMKVGDVVKRLVNAYGATPFQINNGNCDYFANDLAEALKAIGLTKVFHDETPNLAEFPGHCWIVCNGKCYDAESPTGVSRWRQLPIFARILRRQGRWATLKPVAIKKNTTLGAVEVRR